MERARLGLILLHLDYSAWEQARELDDAIEADAAEMVAMLERDFTICGLWVVDGETSLQACLEGLRETALDLAVAAFQTWTADNLLEALVPALGTTPLVLWCYLPGKASVARHAPRPLEGPHFLLNTGPVGAFAALGTLHNLEAPFLFTYGAPDDLRLARDLQIAGRAARARQRLHDAAIGMVPCLDSQARLLESTVPQVQLITLEEYRRAMQAASETDIARYLERLEARFAVKGVAVETLRAAATAMLGLSALARELRLAALGIEIEHAGLLRLLQMRPALYPGLEDEEQALYLPEADLGAAAASLVLHWLTGSPVMLLEMWTWDGPRNQMIGGHYGMQDPQMARPGQAWVSPDTYFSHPLESEGAQIQFIARPGRVTLFQVRCTPRGWQGVAASGMCLDSMPWTETCPHAVVRLDANIDQFLRRIAALGVSQHWAMAYGSVLPEIEAFCQMSNISLELATE